MVDYKQLIARLRIYADPVSHESAIDAAIARENKHD